MHKQDSFSALWYLSVRSETRCMLSISCSLTRMRTTILFVGQSVLSSDISDRRHVFTGRGKHLGIFLTQCGLRATQIKPWDSRGQEQPPSWKLSSWTAFKRMWSPDGGCTTCARTNVSWHLRTARARCQDCCVHVVYINIVCSSQHHPGISRLVWCCSQCFLLFLSSVFLRTH